MISFKDLDERAKLLKPTALKAGRAIEPLFLTKVEKRKLSFQDLTTKGDFISENIIFRSIKKNFSQDRVLSEETEFKEKIISDDDFFWVVDPIDGTYNYSRRRNYSAVSIALGKKNQILAGVVYNPFVDELYFAQKGKGAYLNDKKIYCSKIKQIHKAAFITENYYNPVVVRKNIDLLFKFKRLGMIYINGSAILSICEVAAGKADLYLHTKLKPWDNAAAFLIAQEAGAKITNLKGRTIDFYSSEAVVANPDLLKLFLAKMKK